MALSDFAYNTVTPYGSQTWNGNTQTTTLSPNQQKILGQQEQYSIGVGNKVNNGLMGLGNFGIDASSLPKLDTNAGDSVFQSYMHRLQPQMDHQNESFRQQMANQGIAPGTEAYDNAFRNLSQQQNDLMLQGAANAATAQNNTYNTALNGQVTMGNTPISQLNALRNGLTLNNPTFASQNPIGSQTAAQSAQTAANNNTMNGLFNLGSAALLSKFWQG